MMLYRSADRMLERYIELKSTLSAPKPAPWPDQKKKVTLGRDEAREQQEQLRVEYADIARCIQKARLGADERILLRYQYRQRARYCKRCRRSFPRAGDRHCCPKCRAVRREGWTYEVMPTAEVLAEELTRKTGRKWHRNTVAHVREGAYERLEGTMRKRGMLE